MPYHLTTNDDITSYFLIKNNTARRNQRNSTKYIQSKFIKYNQNNNNTSIISPSSKIQNHKLRQKNKIIPKTLYLHQHQTISPKKHNQSSKIITNPIHLKKYQIRNIQNHELITTKSKNKVTYNSDPVDYSTIINFENTNVRGNHYHLGTDTGHNNTNRQNNNTNITTGENKI